MIQGMLSINFLSFQHTIKISNQTPMGGGPWEVSKEPNDTRLPPIYLPLDPLGGFWHLSQLKLEEISQKIPRMQILRKLRVI